MMRDEGFSLIEVVVALGLFALVSLAGLSLVDATTAAERSTTRRLDALAGADRAFAVITRDLEAARPSLSGSAGALRLGNVVYAIVGGRIVRTRGGEAMTLLDDAPGARWSYLGSRGWQDDWAAPVPPRAVTIGFVVAGRGPVRRVIDLPVPS